MIDERFVMVLEGETKATRIRAMAEKYNDPELYELAAAEFRALGAVHAADRCQERADYYRANKPAPPRPPARPTYQV